MKVFLNLALLAVTLALVAGQCVQESNCMAADECRCASMSPPISGTMPQLISITFNDAITEEYMNSLYVPLLYDLSNPNGEPISATFYVPHEYTDYSKVNELYNNGFEIGVHSITRNSLTDYWANAGVSTLVQEFQGQRQIVSRFANIPIADVVGARVPNLQLVGNNLFEAYKQSGVEYDNTWTARSSNRFFPFSLDQVNGNVPCEIGECPVSQFENIWVAPIIDLVANGLECNNLLACQVDDDAQVISDWLYAEFLNSYDGSRTPISLIANAAWFVTLENAFDGLRDFLERVLELGDVYLVSNKQVIDYMKSPVTADNYVPSVVGGYASCSRRSCPLEFDGDVRYMVACVSSCPSSYPWLGNPTGTAK